MGTRLELQEQLEQLMESSDVQEDDSFFHVYFQPPMSLRMKYPCIRYELSSIDSDYADNGPYRKRRRYSLTFISKDPDDPIVEKISNLPLCSYDRHYTADNLHHDAFSLYF